VSAFFVFAIQVAQHSAVESQQVMPLCEAGMLSNVLRSPPGIRPLVAQRTQAGHDFEMLVEGGEVVEAAFKTNLLVVQSVLQQQFAGMAHAKFEEEAGKTLSGFRLAAK